MGRAPEFVSAVRSCFRSVQEAVPRLDRVWDRRANLVPIALGGARVDVTCKVRDLDEIVELIGNQRHERMPQLIGGPLRPQPGSGAELLEGTPQVGDGHGGAATSSADEALVAVEAEQLRLIAMPPQRLYEKGMQSNPSLTLSCFR